MFAVYTSIAPTVTAVGGMPESAVSAFLLALGLGMVAGTWVAAGLRTGRSSAHCWGHRWLWGW